MRGNIGEFFQHNIRRKINYNTFPQYRRTTHYCPLDHSFFGIHVSYLYCRCTRFPGRQVLLQLSCLPRSGRMETTFLQSNHQLIKKQKGGEQDFKSLPREVIFSQCLRYFCWISNINPNGLNNKNCTCILLLIFQASLLIKGSRKQNFSTSGCSFFAVSNTR